MKTFGEVVAETRRARGLTQKALAARLKKKDGTTIGLAYINDIEHNRRNPPAPHFVAQLAEVLGVPHDVLVSMRIVSMKKCCGNMAILPRNES